MPASTLICAAQLSPAGSAVAGGTGRLGLIPTAPVAAVTGALQWIGRDAFLRHPFNTAYQVNGEDVELCFDVQQHLDQQVWLCTEASAIHEAETTRSRTRFRPATAPISFACAPARGTSWIMPPANSCACCCSNSNENPNCCAIWCRTTCLAFRPKGRRATGRQRLEEQEQVLLSLREERLRLRDQLDARELPLMRAAHLPTTTDQPLKGLKLVVCGYELEQREHRGIAVFSKGLLRSLKQAGAEVWLLSEVAPPMHDMLSRAWLPRAVRRTVFTARLLDQLNSGEATSSPDGALRRWLRSLPLLGWWLEMLEQSQHQVQRLFPRRRIHANQLTRVSAHQLLSSPYQRCERLAYLRDIDGVLCASHCFRDSFSLARFRANQTLQIDLSGFDGLITTSPLNLQPLNAPLFLQTVHDLIPLEYGRTRDHLPSFSRRLLATTRARRIYVSQDAEQKFNAALLAAGTTTQALTPTRVLTQCPSCSSQATPSTGKPAAST